MSKEYFEFVYAGCCVTPGWWDVSARSSGFLPLRSAKARISSKGCRDAGPEQPLENGSRAARALFPPRPYTLSPGQTVAELGSQHQRPGGWSLVLRAELNASGRIQPGVTSGSFLLLSNGGQTPHTLHPGSLNFKEALAIRITEMY